MEDNFSKSVDDNSSSAETLVVLRKRDVPEYLQCGEFYKSLGDDEDDSISVPASTLKPSTHVLNNVDLYNLLSSLRYWGVDEIIPNIVSFCLSGDNSVSSEVVLRNFRESFRYVDIIMQMTPLTIVERAKLAIKSGELDLVTILHESCCALSDGCHIAARAGHLHILQYLHQHGGKIDTLVEQFPTGADSVTYVCACAHAAAGGNLACLEYLHKCGCLWDESVVFSAIWTGQTACIEYALQQGGFEFADDTCCYVAARMGQLHLLKLLFAAGAPWEAGTCTEAAYNGHLACLQYMHENGCPWDEYTCIEAARGGQCDCLRYAHENGCDWDEYVCYHAAQGGHLDCLQYAHENGCPWDVETCRNAAMTGKLECLKYAHEQGCEWDAAATHYAARNGHLDCLQYAHENGCPWDRMVCQSAAANGHLACLQYAHENGCVWWGESVCADAAGWGHMECLRYAHEHGAPWDVDTCSAAAANSLRVLEVRARARV